MPRQHCSADTQLFVPRAGPVPSALPALQLPGLILSSPPGATFVADSIWFQRALRGVAGPLGVIPPISHVKSDLQAALAGASAQPQTGCPCSPIVCGPGVFSQLTCLQVERCEKLETKMVSTEWERAFLYRKEGNTSVGFYFSPPLHPKNTKRLSVFNANVGFKSLRFGLTLQKKKKIWQAFRYDAEKLFSPQFMVCICKAKGWWTE